MPTQFYAGIEATSDDPVTQDVLIAVARGIYQHFWQLRAHLRLDLTRNGVGDGMATK